MFTPTIAYTKRKYNIMYRRGLQSSIVLWLQANQICPNAPRHLGLKCTISHWRIYGDFIYVFFEPIKKTKVKKKLNFTISSRSICIFTGLVSKLVCYLLQSTYIILHYICKFENLSSVALRCVSFRSVLLCLPRICVALHLRRVACISCMYFLQ